MNEQVQTAPAPHFPHTEFRQGNAVFAACPCGWEAAASNHDHSVQLGQEHINERLRAARQSARDRAFRESRVAELQDSIERIVATGGYPREAS